MPKTSADHGDDGDEVAGGSWIQDGDDDEGI
jgi:hypothetical protein